MSTFEKTPVAPVAAVSPPLSPTTYFVVTRREEESPKKRFWKSLLAATILYFILKTFIYSALVANVRSPSEGGDWLPDSLPEEDGHLLVPIHWGQPHPFEGDGRGASTTPHLSSISKPLHLDPSASRHFFKVLGPQSIGRVNFTHSEDTDDVVVRVRAIWKEEDSPYIALNATEGGVYGEAEDGSAGFALLTPKSEVPSNPHHSTKGSSVHFHIDVVFPTYNPSFRVEFLGAVFAVYLGLDEPVQELNVAIKTGSVDVEDSLTASIINISSYFGSITGAFKTRSSLHLSTEAGSITSEVSLLPSSSPYDVDLSSSAGNITATFVSQPLHSTLRAKLTSNIGCVTAHLSEDGFEGSFEASSTIGKVESVESSWRRGRMVEVHEEPGRWPLGGGKTWGIVRWWPIGGKGDGNVVVKSTVGAVKVTL